MGAPVANLDSEEMGGSLERGVPVLLHLGQIDSVQPHHFLNAQPVNDREAVELVYAGSEPSFSIWLSGRWKPRTPSSARRRQFPGWLPLLGRSVRPKRSRICFRRNPACALRPIRRECGVAEEIGT